LLCCVDLVVCHVLCCVDLHVQLVCPVL
jgi:hypothetical protein